MIMSQGPISTIEYLASIPNLVWGAIIGAVAVIIGSLLSWVAVCLQLRHDSKEREKERILTLRREVYLSFAEKVGQMISHLFVFYETKEIGPLGYHDLIMQISIIGGNETIRTVDEFSQRLSESFFELKPKREEINMEFGKWEITNRMLSESVEIGNTGEIVERSKIQYKQLIKLTNALAVKCSEKCNWCQELLHPMFLSIKKELNIPLDEKTAMIRSVLDEQKAKQNLRKYLDSMKQTYDETLSYYESIIKDVMEQ